MSVPSVSGPVMFALAGMLFAPILVPALYLSARNCARRYRRWAR